MNVMITGAAGGLGRAMAVECARRGYNLFLTDVDSSGLSRLREGLQRRFDVLIAARACDLTNRADVDALFLEIDRCGIGFDMLLNIAGMDYEGSFQRWDREQLVRIVSLNDEATLRISHGVLERRRPGRAFSLVFVSSLASMFPMPLKATYAASKRFLLDFATALREELRQQNANVLVLCPGGMATTDQILAAISAQGFWGSITTNPLEQVARRTIDRTLAGKGCFVPGTVNRVLAGLGRLLPRTWVAAAIYRRWSAAQSKWLEADAG